MTTFFVDFLKFLATIVGLIVATSTISSAQDLDENRFVVSVRYDSADGRNVFSLDNMSSSSLVIPRGSTLVFDVSSETLENHPLRLSYTSDGIHSGGVKATTKLSNKKLILSPGTDTPDQLFLYCLNHSGMGQNITISVTGSTTELFLSDFNSTTEQVYIPRVHVAGETPKVYSLQLTLSPDRKSFDLISASEGHTS